MLIAVNIFAFIISIILTNKFYDWAFRQQLVDIPNSRSYHSSNVPSFGGIIIGTTVLLVLVVITVVQEVNINAWFLVAYLLILAIGVLDDLMDIIPIQKIIVEVFAGLILVWGSDLSINSLFGVLSITSFAEPWSTVLTVLFIITIVNAINFIDGIDGLAGLFGLVAAIVYAVIFYQAQQMWLVIFSLTLTGALGGFLIFNFSHRKKIFMGDAGSLSLGFALAFFALNAVNLQPFAPFTNPAEMLLLGISILIVPLFDVLRLFFVRLFSGKSPFRADNNHIHHLFVRNLNCSHRRAAVIIVFINLMLTNSTFWLLRFLDINFSVLIYILIFIGYSIILKLLSKYPEKIIESVS